MNRITKAFALVVALLCALAVALPRPALAAANPWTVTLGADLNAEQRATVLKFFGLTEADLASRNVITVTNADERRYLEGQLPSEVIGDKTWSCSYIQQLDRGGIRVETANLTYVTKNTLYNALQTAGIEHCNLVVTAPFPVTGTGALTGIFMAYEQNGATLEETKKKIATEELVETAQLEQTYGTGVVELVSDVKNQVVQTTKTLSDDQIRELIRGAAATRGIALSDADLDTIMNIIKQIQSLDYNLDAFSNTLEQLNQLVNQATGAAGQASDFFGAIGSFFQGIVDWFTQLFGGTPQDAASQANDFFNNLNTNVFQLDGAK